MIYDTRRLVNNYICRSVIVPLTFCTAHPPHWRIGRNGHGPHQSGVEMKIVSNMSIITPLFIIMKTQPSSILNKVCYHVAVQSHKRPGCGDVRMCEVILRPCKSLWGGASSSRTWQIDLKLSDFFVFLVWLKGFFLWEKAYVMGYPKEIRLYTLLYIWTKVMCKVCL